VAGDVQSEMVRLKNLITNLENAIATGARSVFSDGERLEYQDTRSMLLARDDFKRQLGNLQRSNRSPWQSFNQRPTMRW
jgi:hypothetical protein